MELELSLEIGNMTAKKKNMKKPMNSDFNIAHQGIRPNGEVMDIPKIPSDAWFPGFEKIVAEHFTKKCKEIKNAFVEKAKNGTT